MLHLDFDRTLEFARQRHAALRLEAEADRMGRKSAPGLFDTLLARLGSLLVAAGRRLETRAQPQSGAPQLSLNL